MRVNRRNVILGLGTIVAGGGAAIGTGAFSSAEATRTATVNTAGDDAALLQIGVDDGYDGISASNTDSEIEISFDDINENGVTAFDSALEITNGGSNGVDITIEVSSGAGLVFYDDGDGESVTDGQNSITKTGINSAASTAVGIGVNTNTDDPSPFDGSLSDADTVDITITAEDNS